jgi:serine/threonine protein kinase/WD40 repeat protein/Flp pilus assembly protein TadD
MLAEQPDLHAIFNEAIALEASEERSRFLSEVCGNDSKLRERIEALLRAHSEAGGFFGGRPDPEATELVITERVGIMIGPYKLLQQIGEGGMGVVYMAEQLEPVRRRVALKIIKPGMDSRQVIARFEAERQALSLMDHPNIARVLDAGTTESGRPYFVMELVRGQPITQYCDEHHLTPRQRLELLLPVCQAIQHAHQKGIIHRDIKPSNILIAEYDHQSVPKVIDFGVAKAISQSLTEKTMFTGLGQIVGTLEYMSPEQAKVNQLDIDTRSDIYSLGVLLYELLTGSTPFDKRRLRSAGWDEMLRIIREEEPPKPSTKLSSSESLPSVAASRSMEPARLSRTVRGELDWIVMKALEKDRNRRYETANGLAMDLQRYLHDEPVQACPPSALYRLGKLARRNKVALATSAVVLAALLVGMVASTWQAIRATRAEGLAQTRLQAEEQARRDAELARDGEERQRRLADEQSALARKNAEEADGQRQKAEANFGKARQAVDEYLTHVTESELLSVPGLQPLREDLLQAALTFYTGFTQERADDPTLQRELASAHYRVGMIQRDLGNAAAARAANQESIRLLEQLRDQGQVSVELQSALASAYFFAGRHGDTVKLCQAIMQGEPGDATVRSLLADAYNELAVAASNKKDLAAALKYHQQAFDLREVLVRDFPDDSRYLAQLGATVNNLAVLLDSQGKSEDALTMFERAAEYTAQAYERAPHSILWGRWLCTQLQNVASNQAALGKQDESLHTYQRLVTVSRKRAFENPAIGSLRADLCRAYLALGNYQKRLGDAAEGSRSFRLARDVLEQTPRETPDQLFELATVYAVLATPLAESLEPSEEDAGELKRNADLAMETLKKAVEAGYQKASVLGTNHDLDPLRDRDDFQTLLATVQKVAEADRLAKAEDKDATKKLSNRRQAADLLKGLASAQPANLRHRATLAATLQSIGVIQTGLKQFDDAERSLDDALKLRQQLLQQQSENPQAVLDVIDTRVALAELYEKSARLPEAHAIWQECLTRLENRPNEAPLATKVQELERRICYSYGALGIWPLAVIHSQRNAQLQRSANVVATEHFAILLAVTGHEDALRAYCRLWHEQASGAGPRVWSQQELLHLARLSSLLSPPALPAEQLEQWTQPYESSTNAWEGLCVALARHRAGKHVEALQILDSYPSQADYESLGSYAPKLSAAYLCALAAAGANQQDRARNQFQKAESLYQHACQSCVSGGEVGLAMPLRDFWWELAAGQILRREAWQVITGKAPADPWQHLIQARGYRLIGDEKNGDVELAAAENAWQRMLELAGDDPRPWIQRGRWYTERGEHEKADADFAKAASLTPNELNRFLEAGWWASTSPEGLSPLLPRQTDNSPVLTTPEAAPVSFTVVRCTPYGMGQQVEFRNAPEFKEADTAYAMTYVYAPEAKGVTLLVGGQASVELRLNGRRVYESKTYLSPFNAVRIPALLRAGRNTLVARVPDPGRGQALILRIGDNRLDRGLELARIGLWDEALPLLNAEFAEGQRPNEHVWTNYSVLLSATGDFAAYRELYHKVLNWIDDTNWSISMHASNVSTLAPVPDTDIARLVRLVDDAAAKASASSMRWAGDVQSRVYFRAGRYQEVLDRMQTAGWNRSALRALCWHHLGDANKAKSDMARAEREFVEMVRMGREGPASAAVFSSPNGLLDLGAYVLLREARTLIAPGSSPDDEALHALQNQVRQQLQAADPRLLPFDLALIQNGKNPERWLERGRARAILGLSELAQADFDKAAAIAPNNPEMLASRCLIYAELNRLEEALADLVKLLDEEPDPTKAPARLAAQQHLFHELGQWPELFDRITQIRSADPSPWIGRARYHLSRVTQADGSSGEAADKAIADLRQAVARGFRDFDQLNNDTFWQPLKSRQDFQALLREMAERNVDDLLLLAKLEGHTELVRGVAFLPDGQRLVSVGRDKLVRVWDLETRSVLTSFAVEGYLRDADVSTDGRLVGVVSNDGEMKGLAHVWDLHKQELLGEFVQDLKWAQRIRFSPDGTHVVTSGKPPGGVLWELSTGKEQQRFKINDTSDTQAVAFSPDGRLLALSTVGRVNLFEITGNAPLSTIRLPNNRYIEELVFSASGAHLASSQNGGHVSLIDVDSRRVIKTLTASESTVGGLQFLNGDRFILAASLDGTVRIWDIQQASVINTAASKAGSKELAVSPDGHFAVTAGGEDWDEASKKWKPTGDYALRLWQLPRIVWPNKETASESEQD